MAHVLVSRLSVPIYSLKGRPKLPKPPEELTAFPISGRIFWGILVNPQPFGKFHLVIHFHTVIFDVIEWNKEEIISAFRIIHRILAEVIEESAHTLSRALENLHIVGIFKDTARNCGNNRLGVMFGCLVPRRNLRIVSHVEVRTTK